jgi:hypothetical protein
VQSHHHQAAHYSCLLKIHSVTIVSYGSLVCGDMAACIGSVFVDVCMSYCSEVDARSECENYTGII